MALWQYDLYIFPSKIFTVVNQNPRDIDSSVDLLENRFLKNKYLMEDFEWVKNIFLESSSWSSSVKIFGDIESHCVQVHLEKGFIFNILLRIDFTQIDWREIISVFVTNAQMRGLMFTDLDGLPVKIDEEIIISLVQESNQYTSHLLTDTK